MRDTATTREIESFWRGVPRDFLDNYAGDVEAPCGWFARVIVDTEWCDALADEYPGVEIPAYVRADTAGYFLQINSDGTVWAYVQTADDYDGVSGAYARAEDSYGEWLAQDEVWA